MGDKDSFETWLFRNSILEMMSELILKKSQHKNTNRNSGWASRQRKWCTRLYIKYEKTL